jgi:hypothetical protein
MEPSFVEFEFTDDKRFAMLATVVDALRAAKQSDSFPPDEYWFSFFDREALSYFWWPTEEEIQDWKSRWEATPIPQRFTDPSLQTPWLFGSMLDAFHDGEYELIGCSRLPDNRGRLEFIPYAGPYGGTDCMKALIEAFGFKVVGEFE